MLAELISSEVLSPGRADGCLLQKSLYPLLSVSEFVLISLFVRKMLDKY